MVHVQARARELLFDPLVHDGVHHSGSCRLTLNFYGAMLWDCGIAGQVTVVHKLCVDTYTLQPTNSGQP